MCLTSLTGTLSRSGGTGMNVVIGGAWSKKDPLILAMDFTEVFSIMVIIKKESSSIANYKVLVEFSS